MSNDVFYTDEPVFVEEQNLDEVQEWRHLVQKRHGSTDTIALKICEVNETIDREVTDIRAGDEIVLHDVSVKDVRVTLEENYKNPDKLDSESILMPAAICDGKFRPCPHYNPTHTFKSVQEILDIFPFVSDLIFPEESFKMEGVEIAAWDLLHIVDKVESPSIQSLRVLIVKKQRHILLPASLNRKFLQYNDNSSLQDSKILERLKPGLYSLSELCDFWSERLNPMTVKIHDETTCERPNCVHTTAKSPKSISKIFKIRKPSKSLLTLTTPPTSSTPSTNDFFMIPETWRSKRLVIEPIHIAKVTNSSTGKKLVLRGELNLKVKPLKIDKPQTPEAVCDGGIESPRRQRLFSDISSVPLHQLNILSLMNTKDRSDAIVAVVTSSLTNGSKRPDSLALGTKIALHRTRRVRKMLLKSQDSQYYLVSAYYAGEFKRLPLIFNLAGEVPIKSDTPYITRCTAYPVQKQLDSCHEGQYVWFLRQTEIPINETPTPTKVVQCRVADSLDGQQQFATFPLNLRGRFERVDATPTEISTRDLFRKELPVCIKVENQDPSIGFDPLMMKKHFQVIKIVSEQTVIVEILKKGKDESKSISSGTLRELSVKRDSLFVREIPTKSIDPFRGIDPYPIRKDFKGLRKLPCVEMLAECDVAELQDALRSVSSASTLSQSFDGVSSPIHSLSSSVEDRRDTIFPVFNSNQHVVKPGFLSPRKSKSVEDLTEVCRVADALSPQPTKNIVAESNELEKPEIPDQVRRPTQLINYEHAKDLQATNMESQTNYEHAEDVVLKRELLVNGKARPKPKPKPRRKTLPGQVVLNADECLAKKVEIPLSNGISKHNSISSDIRSSVIPSNTVFKNYIKNSEEQGISKSNEKDLDSDYEDVEASSDTNSYEDVAEELNNYSPSTAPKLIPLLDNPVAQIL